MLERWFTCRARKAPKQTGPSNCFVERGQEKLQVWEWRGLPTPRPPNLPFFHSFATCIASGNFYSRRRQRARPQLDLYVLPITNLDRPGPSVTALALELHLFPVTNSSRLRRIHLQS